MKYSLLAIVLALVTIAHAQASTPAPGMRSLSISNPTRDQDIQAMIWYPAASDVPATDIGANAVFKGNMAQVDAPIASGRHPLIMLSHGGFRSAANSADWLASALSAKGYVVAIVNPPAMPGGPPTTDVMNELRLRPQDVSQTVSTILTDEFWKNHIDADRIGAVGFFLGGYAVMALIGLQLDADKLTQACQGEASSLDCEWFASSGLDLQAIDMKSITQPIIDSRIKTVVAIDPEWVQQVSRPSLAHITAPLHLLNVGPWTETDAILNASSLGTATPNTSYSSYAGAGRFSTFAECTDNGVTILQEDGDDGQICLDGSISEPRNGIHAELVEIIAQLLHTELEPRPAQ